MCTTQATGILKKRHPLIVIAPKPESWLINEVSADFPVLVATVAGAHPDHPQSPCYWICLGYTSTSVRMISDSQMHLDL